MARKPRTEQAHQLALSDEAAAYIALMQLALEFENNHFAQIRRHYQAITLEPDEDPRQLQLFPKHPSSPFDRQPEF
jgi:c-di-GMP-related signal transduction protein